MQDFVTRFAKEFLIIVISVHCVLMQLLWLTIDRCFNQTAVVYLLDLCYAPQCCLVTPYLCINHRDSNSRGSDVVITSKNQW